MDHHERFHFIVHYRDVPISTRPTRLPGTKRFDHAIARTVRTGLHGPGVRAHDPHGIFHTRDWEIVHGLYRDLDQLVSIVVHLRRHVQ